jgi:hypothetical protein
MHRIIMIAALLVPPALVAAEPGGLDRVMAYAGTWKTDTRHFDTPYSKAGHDSAVLQNDCWRSGGYFACRQIVDGDSKALLVFIYDPKTDRYTSYPIMAGGGDAHPGTLIIQGTTWTFPWDYTEAGKTTHFRVVNLWSSADSIEFHQEYSADGEHWTRMAEGHEQRVK